MTSLRTKLILLLTTAVAACLLLAACGDDDNTDATPTGSPNASQDANAVQQLRDLAGKWTTASGKITYTLTNAAGDASVVVYRQGPDTRIEHTISDRTTTVIVRSDTGYSCVNVSNSCAPLSVEQATESAGFIPYVLSLTTSEGLDSIIAGADSIEGASGRNLAGRDTACIIGDGPLGGIPGPTTFCFSDDGLLLLVKYEGGSAFEMAATSIEEAQASDFDPPYAVVTPQSASATATP